MSAVDNLEVWSPNNPLNKDGDIINFILDRTNGLTVGFVTDANTNKVRTGAEYKGIQFDDVSTPSNPDSIFTIEKNVKIDANIEFTIEEA